MRVKSLLAVTALGIAGLAVSAPAANAAPAEEGVTTVWAGSFGTAQTDCVGSVGVRYHRTSCYKSAPRAQYRALVACSNGTVHRGVWRWQTRNLSNQSTAWCPSGTHRTNIGWAFRYAP